MNIYDARKLQKQLYKRSNTPYKHLRTTIEDGEVSYDVITAISDSNFRTIDIKLINALSPSIENEDVFVVMFYHDGYWVGWPTGMYLAEIIKID